MLIPLFLGKEIIMKKIILMMLLMLSIMTFTAFGATVPSPPALNGYNNYFVYYISSNNTYWAIYTPSTVTGYMTSSDNTTITYKDATNNPISVVAYQSKWDGTQWVGQGTLIASAYSQSGIARTYNYSSLDIKTSSGSVFFSQPKGLAAIKGELLSPAISQVVGLIPLVIPLVVGFLGLRKALAMVSAVLHQA